MITIFHIWCNIISIIYSKLNQNLTKWSRNYFNLPTAHEYKLCDHWKCRIKCDVIQAKWIETRSYRFQIFQIIAVNFLFFIFYFILSSIEMDCQFWWGFQQNVALKMKHAMTFWFWFEFRLILLDCITKIKFIFCSSTELDTEKVMFI